MATPRPSVWDVQNTLVQPGNSTESQGDDAENADRSRENEIRKNDQDESDIEVPVIFSDDEPEPGGDVDEAVDDMTEIPWSENDRDIVVEEFTERTGPQVLLPLNSQEIDYFKLFFTYSLIDKLVEETNTFARLKGTQSGLTQTMQKCLLIQVCTIYAM